VVQIDESDTFKVVDAKVKSALELSLLSIF